MANKKTPEEYVLDIQEACQALGWQIAMSDADVGISGLIIGSEKFVTDVIEELPNSDEYEIWEMPETDTSLH